MTTKQRSKLRSHAQNIEPVGQVGKGGLSENMISGLSDALEKRELVKITVLNNAEDDISDIAAELAEKLGAEVVCVIGHKVVLYRLSHKENVKHIEF